MNWTAPELIMVIGAIGSLMTLIGKTWIDMVNASKTQIAVANVKHDLATNTMATIETKNIVNGQREAMVARVAVLEATISDLREQVREAAAAPGAGRRGAGI